MSKPESVVRDLEMDPLTGGESYVDLTTGTILRLVEPDGDGIRRIVVAAADSGEVLRWRVGVVLGWIVKCPSGYSTGGYLPRHGFVDGRVGRSRQAAVEAALRVCEL